MIGNPASEQEPGGSPGALGSGLNAGVRRVEAEAVRAPDRARYLVQPASQVQKFSGAATGGDMPSQTPANLRGQCRRDKETPRFEVEGLVHGSKTLGRPVVGGRRGHSSGYHRLAAGVERKV